MNTDNNSTYTMTFYKDLDQESIDAIKFLQKKGDIGPLKLLQKKEADVTCTWPNASQEEDVVEIADSHLVDTSVGNGSGSISLTSTQVENNQSFSTRRIVSSNSDVHNNDPFAANPPPPPTEAQEEKSKVQTQDLNNGTSPIQVESGPPVGLRSPINTSDARIRTNNVDVNPTGGMSGGMPRDMPRGMSGGMSGGTPIGMSTGGGGHVSGSTDTHSGVSSKKPSLMDAIKSIKESNPDSYFAGSYFPEDVLRIFRNGNVTYMKVFAYFVNTPHGPWTYFGKTFNKKEEWDKFFKEYTFYVTHDVIPSNMFFESVGTVFSISKLEEFGMRTELTYDEKKRYGLVSNAVIVPKKQPENKATHKVKEVKDEYLENHIIYNGMPMVMGCGYVTSYPSYGGFSFQSGNYIMS